METMNLEQLAVYLRRDVREVTKLATRGHLPGRKVSGEWRFSRAEITHWVETQLHDYSAEQLADLDSQPAAEEPELVIGTLLTEACIAVPLQARTKASVLKEMVTLAEQSWQVYDPAAILEALTVREEICSTAQENGVAMPHPRRPLPNALGEPVVAFARTSSGIPFGAPRGILTDIIVLVCCRDDRSHLRTLARLARILRRDGLLEALREADTPRATFELLAQAEREVVMESGERRA
jgi:PTS system nitrogen regulatory IIA component